MQKQFFYLGRLCNFKAPKFKALKINLSACEPLWLALKTMHYVDSPLIKIHLINIKITDEAW